jgi:L-asparaginase
MSLRIIATGGTFDKYYDPIGGKLTFENSHLPEILQTARLYEPAELEIVTLIDSLDMGDEQRLAILEACRKAPEQRIVIVHGTDTMMKTAELIGSSRLEKCVVLTGAMVPYSISRSDALFNLGSAVMAAQLLPNGTWVAMNGRVLSWKDVKKDRERGMFVRIEPSK